MSLIGKEVKLYSDNGGSIVYCNIDGVVTHETIENGVGYVTVLKTDNWVTTKPVNLVEVKP